MIKDILNSNEEILPNTKQIEVLKENFPACFNADGSFDIERFKEYLSDKLMVSNEGYELKFLGKNYARLLASIDTTTVIVPDEEHNNKPENKDSQNIYISGDNLDGLKQLLKSYAHQVKCIYIDPPYNTGSDGFVYNDNFNFSAEELSTKLSIDEEQAQRILDLTKRGSASHSAWLMFMYPRLLLARDLLTDDGVIFISIDDNECHNLKLLCDDVFGEENFIAEFPRITKRGGKSSDIIAKNHDYFLMYNMELSLSDLSACHAGYFSQDNSDSDEDIAKEVDTILHGKTQLLSFKNEDGTLNTLRFLFSKWTLKEGWDNPNVFTIAKLRSSGSENSKLQEVGRGLRLPVDENGNRISNEEFTLNYIVDFTEADFAQKLVDQINGELPQTAIISEEKLNAVAKKIGKSSDDLFDELYNKRYIDRHLNIKPETRDLFFAEYPDFTAGLSAGKVKDRNKDKPKPVKIRKAVYNEIKELWETINHRYLLFYDNDLNNNLDDVVLKLFEKPGVFTDLVMRSDRDVVKSTGAEMNVIRETGVQYVIRKTIPYNVFLKRISSATNLPIKVLHTALTKYAQKHGTEFTAHINENTVAGFCAEFSAWKNDNLQGRFRYERSKAPLGATALTYADGTVRSEISQGRIGTKIVPGTPSGKYLYDSYAYDSPLEKDNIIADIDEVIVYGKIPRASIAIPTITGGMYSPDFMYVVKHKNGHKELNIIVETKDVENKTDLRGTEKAKIECAKVFFNMLTADGYTVHFRDQLGNKQMAQIISEIMRGEN